VRRAHIFHATDCRTVRFPFLDLVVVLDRIEREEEHECE
jgi:hypothetical protein